MYLHLQQALFSKKQLAADKIWFGLSRLPFSGESIFILLENLIYARLSGLTVIAKRQNVGILALRSS